MARHSITGTDLFTVDGKDDTFGDVEHVFRRGFTRGHADRVGMIAKVEGGYIAFAEGDRQAADAIGPEINGGLRTRRAAAESAAEMTARAPEFRAALIAQIAATA